MPARGRGGEARQADPAGEKMTPPGPDSRPGRAATGDGGYPTYTPPVKPGHVRLCDSFVTGFRMFTHAAPPGPEPAISSARPSSERSRAATRTPVRSLGLPAK